MVDNFGLRIGLEGEKDFKNALRDINQNFKVLASEMKLVTSQFDRHDRSKEAEGRFSCFRYLPPTNESTRTVPMLLIMGDLLKSLAYG
ncbi:hypothetical protein J2S13_003030 [Oikeobacillus pervagus]|uniref:Uncharacterized protein n=1 Tax=Oikeobacillus pervagus TaxID=1325931 RepID=A0AAJ1WKG2_9BACI|nr:hypothetical protein [Oikeobacillus pervagus]MDQ0216568.1 hypothetical protein [Oikeobacillus pervagus]